MKKIIVFDLDGTLAASKSPLEDRMSDIASSIIRLGLKVAALAPLGRPMDMPAAVIRLKNRTLYFIALPLA